MINTWHHETSIEIHLKSHDTLEQNMKNAVANHAVHTILSAIIAMTEQEADGHNTTICGLARIGLNTTIEAMEQAEPLAA